MLCINAAFSSGQKSQKSVKATSTKAFLTNLLFFMCGFRSLTSWALKYCVWGSGFLGWGPWGSSTNAFQYYSVWKDGNAPNECWSELRVRCAPCWEYIRVCIALLSGNRQMATLVVIMPISPAVCSVLQQTKITNPDTYTGNLELARSHTHSLMQACTHAGSYACTHSCLGSHTHALTHSLTHSLTHLITHSLSQSVNHSHTSMNTHSCLHAHTCTRTHAHTHKHTHKHTHTHTSFLNTFRTRSTKLHI